MGVERMRLGDLLLQERKISAEQLTAGLAEQRRTGRPLGRILVELGMLTEGDLVGALARQVGIPFVDLADAQIDPAAVVLLPEAMAKRHHALPIGFEDGRIVVAMADPGNVLAIDDIRSLTRRDVKPVVATKADILAAIMRFSRVSSDASEMAASAAEELRAGEDLTSVKEVVEDGPIVKLVDLLITQAVQERASDIHVEPQEQDLRIRYRVDGVLHETMRPPKSIQSGLVSRFKVMAEMNIAERRVPQDGRVSTVVGGRPVDLRVATLPTVYGEKVVIRILDKAAVLMRLEDLGFSPANFTTYEGNYTRPHGLILVTGPTGSGKSTTLYATLNIVNSPDRNIITVEDPVEYRLAGINQVQVNVKAGLTFAAALRSILRSDPDVVLIGEIRDRETAQIAVEAALTGHLVLSSLHTNDAPSALGRLTEMGIEPFLVASATTCVLAQRLARRLCSRCKEAYTPSEQALDLARWDVPRVAGQPVTLYRPVGCGSCSRTGYKGRLALHEVMDMREDIARMCVERRSSDEIAQAAGAHGMLPLRNDGLRKVSEGVTSLEEILRVVV